MRVVTLVVEYTDHQRRYFPVPEGQGWRIDAAYRCIVIGHGVPRTMVPLDRVTDFTIESHECTP